MRHGVGLLTAILLRYWTERDENFETIITDLRAGSVVPDRIVLWDQSNAPPLDLDVDTIRSPLNFGIQVVYAAATLFPGDSFLFLDDDLTVGPLTVACLQRYACPTRVVGMRGLLGDWPNNRVWPNHDYRSERLYAPVPCDWLIGRITLIGWQAILRYLTVAAKFTDPFCEDTVMGAVNDCIIVPANSDEMYRDLSEHGVGLEHVDDDAYYAMRYRTLRTLADL